MMNYKDYQNSRDAAWRILIDADVRRMPVKVIKLCRGMGIPVQMFNDQAGDGYSTIIEGKPIIFCSQSLQKERQRFTVAHELGHIILGHVGEYQLVNREPSSNDNPIEQQANIFAARLLAPACVLHEAEAFTVERIMQLCDISRTFARFRLARLLQLEQRNKDFQSRYGYGCFYLSPLERQVYKQFEKYIRTL